MGTLPVSPSELRRLSSALVDGAESGKRIKPYVAEIIVGCCDVLLASCPPEVERGVQIVIVALTSEMSKNPDSSIGLSERDTVYIANIVEMAAHLEERSDA